MPREPRRVELPASLPDAELEVLACLWRQGEATARALREGMAEYRPMTHGAMMTLLKRLESKRLVSRRKGPVGKAFVYAPSHNPEPLYRRILRDLRQRLFGGSGVSLVTSLFQGAPPTPEELDQLQVLLDELRAKRDEGGC